MIDPVRQEVITSAPVVVVKIGTAVLTRPDGKLDRVRLTALVGGLNKLLASGRRLVIVSSGAIGAGMGQLELARRPADLRHLQAAAAVGQCHLIREYDRALRRHGYHAAQILLTARDIENRTRFLNVRNTILTLFEYQAVPVINENDTVSVDELRFGDNDVLAGMVTNMLRAPLLIILTSVDGLYRSDPRAKSAASRQEAGGVISTVMKIDPEITAYAGNSPGTLGSGGMLSKLEAARMCTSAGESVWIVNGNDPHIFDQILSGQPVGTLFLPRGAALKSRKRWIGYMVRPRGQYLVDDGARRALVQQGKSLLPIGIRQVVGNFVKGDVVRICGTDGSEFARGLTNLSSQEAQSVQGLRSVELRAARIPYDEVVHRDNLVVTVATT